MNLNKLNLGASCRLARFLVSVLLPNFMYAVRDGSSSEEAGHDATFTFLIFRLLKNYDDI